jgi:hypothetical protein
MRSGVSSLDAPRDAVQCLQRLKVFENFQYIGTVSESLVHLITGTDRKGHTPCVQSRRPVVNDGDTGKELRNARVNGEEMLPFNHVNGRKANDN